MRPRSSFDQELHQRARQRMEEPRRVVERRQQQLQRPLGIAPHDLKRGARMVDVLECRVATLDAVASVLERCLNIEELLLIGTRKV